MRHFILTIAYDGSKFEGYQRQVNTVTVQSSIEAALKILFSQKINLVAAGRTDKGVHALGQVIDFRVDTFLTKDKIKNFLNKMLQYIEVLKVEEEEEYTEAEKRGRRIINLKELEQELQGNRELDKGVKESEFHSRFSAKSRTYVYKLKRLNDKTVFNSSYYGFSNELDKKELEQLLSKFLGRKDFKYFSYRVPLAFSTIKTITNIKIDEKEDAIEIRLTADSFLRGMVRAILGTVLMIVDRKLDEKLIEKAFQDPSISVRRHLASPGGLYLEKIEY